MTRVRLHNGVIEHGLGNIYPVYFKNQFRDDTVVKAFIQSSSRSLYTDAAQLVCSMGDAVSDSL